MVIVKEEDYHDEEWRKVTDMMKRILELAEDSDFNTEYELDDDILISFKQPA